MDQYGLLDRKKAEKVIIEKDFEGQKIPDLDEILVLTNQADDF